MSNFPIICEFGKSTELYELCAKKYGAKQDIETWCHAITISIINAAQKLKNDYDQKLLQYNSSATTSNGLFLTPNIKVTIEPNRTYVVLRWARIVNGPYIGKPSKPDEWSLREITRAGKINFSESDFKPFLRNIDINIVNTVLETEHALRYLRQQYLLVGDMYKMARKMILPEFQNLLVKGEDTPLSNSEERRKHSFLSRLEANSLDFDPLHLPKSISLINGNSRSLKNHQNDTSLGTNEEEMEF